MTIKISRENYECIFKTCGSKSHAVGISLQSGLAFSHLSSAIFFPLINAQRVQIGFCFKERMEILAVVTFMDQEISL